MTPPRSAANADDAAGLALEADQPVEHAPKVHQFTVCAHLDDSPGIQHNQAIGLAEGGQSVGDGERGAALHEPPEPFLYEADFWARVGLFSEAASALVRLEARLGTPSGDVSTNVKKQDGSRAVGT